MQCARQKNGRSERASTPRERGNGNEEARKMAEEEAMVHGARFHRARFPLDAEDVSELWRRWRRRWQLLACRSSINISPFASSEQSGSLLILTKSSKYQQQRALQEVRNKTPFLVSVGFGILSLFSLCFFRKILRKMNTCLWQISWDFRWQRKKKEVQSRLWHTTCVVCLPYSFPFVAVCSSSHCLERENLSVPVN